MSVAGALPIGTPVRRTGLGASPAWRRFRRHRGAQVGLGVVVFFALLALFAPVVAPYSPTDADLAQRLAPRSAAHWLGMDQQGRDLLSRIIYGGRVSLVIGVIAVGVAAVIGLPLGAVAGYRGGWVGQVLMTLIDILLSFPAILVAIIIVALFGPGIRNAMIAIGVSQMPVYARLIRGEVIKLRSETFVEAARAIGLSERRVLIRHVLPNAVGPIIVQSTLNLAGAILSAAYLGFLGLGAQPPTPEWGAMLSDGRTYLRTAPHVAIYPGLAVMLVVLGFNLFGDGLRDALDPRATRR
ncbi:MAG: ABC transporter permease [Armatimonadota bacterium]|nr:ABC transporter permease [Armatimonadota bacterium]